MAHVCGIVCVSKDRIAEIWIRRIAESFASGPTIVRPGDTVVDLFPRVLADIVDEHSSDARLK